MSPLTGIYGKSSAGGDFGAWLKFSGFDYIIVEGKADIVIFNQNSSALGETGVVCSFAKSWGDWYHRLYADMLRSATGIEAFGDRHHFGQAAERIINLERAFNVRRGQPWRIARSRSHRDHDSNLHRGRSRHRT